MLNFRRTWSRCILDVSPIESTIISMIPEYIWESKEYKFFDPSMAGGQLLIMVADELRKRGHTDENINSRISGFTDDHLTHNLCINKFKKKGLDIKFEVGNFLEGNMTKKFDVIIANPPYDGAKKLHQQFFNKAVESIVNGGYICFIQPATPYLNKKENQKNKHEEQMITNILRYDTHVKFMPPYIFDRADISVDLAVTALHKKIGEREIKVYSDDGIKKTPIEGINQLGIPSDIFLSIRDKYKKYIDEHGSIGDITGMPKDTPVDKVGAYIQAIRGNAHTSDFYSIVSNNQIYYRVAREDDIYSAYVKLEELDNFYTYVKTFVARMGLALSKFNINNAKGELKTVPLVPFDHIWTDEKLAKLIGLTDEELEILRQYLPDYHGLLK